MNAYYFIVVPFMAVMCIVFAWIIAGDIKAILRSMRGKKYDSIHKMGQNYGQAAIFIGTACLFIGDPDECGELADSLQHYAQQAKARALKGDETFETFEIL